jgi:hypothetical protein
MSTLKPIIIEEAGGLFYAMVGREASDGMGGVETVLLRGYDARHFKTRAGAEKSTAAYIAKITNKDSK